MRWKNNFIQLFLVLTKSKTWYFFSLILLLGNTVFHTALMKKDYEILTLLMDQEFNIDQQNRQGKTVLHLAILNKNFTIFNLLMGQNPDLKLLDEDGNSYMDLALWNFDQNIFTKLSSELEDKMKDLATGCTWLHYAAQHNLIKPAEILLTNGYDVDIRDKKKQSPLHYAVAHKKVFITYFLNLTKFIFSFSKKFSLDFIKLCFDF